MVLLLLRALNVRRKVYDPTSFSDQFYFPERKPKHKTISKIVATHMPTAISTASPAFSKKFFCEDHVSGNRISISIFPLLQQKKLKKVKL